MPGTENQKEARVNQKKLENRCVELKELRVRASADSNAPVIEGHAAVFDEWSELLGSMFPFKEKVRHGAFSETIGKDDIRALFNHNPDYVLGRNKAGTLELEETEQGLLVRILPPDTQWARDLQVSIGRGDITQMSIGFEVLEDKWATENGVDIRDLIKVKLYDVSPVTFPAYTQTDVGLRGMESYNKLIAERRQATADDDAKEKAQTKQRLNAVKTKFKII
jgi:HK97 family phage prohead protease